MVTLAMLPLVARAQQATARVVVRGPKVANLAESASWYARAFGLPQTLSSPATGETPAVVVPSGDGLAVELMQARPAAPARASAPEGPRGIAKVGLLVDHFDAVVAHLRAIGIDIAFGPFPARPDQPANAILRDVEGNLLQIVAHGRG